MEKDRRALMHEACRDHAHATGTSTANQGAISIRGSRHFFENTHRFISIGGA